MDLYDILGCKKEYLKGKKAIIFDMDGTLIDSMQYWMANDDADLTVYPTHIQFMFEKYNTVIKPKENALEFLSFLKANKVPVAIASDTPKKLAQGFIDRYDFESYIDFYVGSDDVGVYKQSSSAIFLLAAKKLGVEPQECIVFEDNYTSVVSAKNAGMDVIGVYDSENAYNEERIRAICVDYIYNMGEMM